MKRFKMASLAATFLVSCLFSLCNATVSKPEVLDDETISSEVGLAKYDTLVIKDITSEDTEVLRKDDIENYSETLKAMLDSYYTELSSRVKVPNGFKDVYRNDSKDSNTVILETNFVTINPGNRALRFWIGFVGEASISIKGKIVDKQTGEVLFKFRQRRISPLSWDNAKDVLVNDTKELAEDVSKFLLKLRQ